MDDYIPKCPVCGTPTSRTNDCIEGTVCEAEEVCPKGCFRYFFAYGSSEWEIKGRVWGGHYTESPEEQKRRQQEMGDWLGQCREGR